MCARKLMWSPASCGAGPGPRKEIDSSLLFLEGCALPAWKTAAHLTAGVTCWEHVSSFLRNYSCYLLAWRLDWSCSFWYSKLTNQSVLYTAKLVSCCPKTGIKMVSSVNHPHHIYHGVSEPLPLGGAIQTLQIHCTTISHWVST